jgi:hypothetical protein
MAIICLYARRANNQGNPMKKIILTLPFLIAACNGPDTGAGFKAISMNKTTTLSSFVE